MWNLSWTLRLIASVTLASATALSSPPSHGSDGKGAIRPDPSRGHWVDTWTAMPQLTEFSNLPPPPFNQTELVFHNSTIRQTIHVSIGAKQIRLRLSNAFGLTDLPITAVTIAAPTALNGQNKTGSSTIDVKSLKSLTWSGDQSVTIPSGGLAVSDPVDFAIAPESVLSISIYLKDGQATQYITSHPGSRTSSWVSYGDYTPAANMTDSTTSEVFHWYFISALEAWSPPQSSSWIIVGDSITDGRSSYNNANRRWPDLVLARMQRDPFTKNIGVCNQAAGGNRVLYDGLGPNAVSRIDRDLLSQSGVKYAMIFEGVNDIGSADNTIANQTVTGDRLIQAYKQIITRVHTAGIPMFGATITPFGGPNDTSAGGYSSPLREQTRLRVNEWIRSGGWFDAVIDFDAVVRDPSNHTQLKSEYNSGDYLHPSPAGYMAMANAFPLNIFRDQNSGVSTFM